MKVLVKIKGVWIEAIAIPCGSGDCVEVRDGKAKGFHCGRGQKWKRLDGRQSTRKKQPTPTIK